MWRGDDGHERTAVIEFGFDREYMKTMDVHGKATREGVGVSVVLAVCCVARAHIRIRSRSEKHFEDFVVAVPRLCDRIVVDTRLGSDTKELVTA